MTHTDAAEIHGCAATQQQDGQRQPSSTGTTSGDYLAPMPEAAWLRLVSQLDWVSACALSSASGEAKAETMAARGALADTIKERTLELRLAEEKSLEEKRQVEERLEQQRALLAEALVHLQPLRNRTHGLNNQALTEGMRQVFTELEQDQPRRLADRAAAESARRQEHLDGLRSNLAEKESAVRERIADGELRPEL